MKTIIYFDTEGNPVASTTFADDVDVSIDTATPHLITEQLNVGLEVLIERWRIKDGLFQDVGLCPKWNRWDSVSGSWVEDLNKAKVEKWNEIKAARSRDEFGGFTHNGMQFDSDAASQSRIQGAVILAMLAAQTGQQYQVDWTLQDNSVALITGPEMIGVGQSLAMHVAAVHQKSQSLRAGLDGATSLSQVQALQW